jgi:putative transposase
MRLSSLGEVVCDTWYDLSNHICGIELDAFVVMPNHIHGIIIINDITVGGGLGTRPYRETTWIDGNNTSI